MRHPLRRTIAKTLTGPRMMAVLGVLVTSNCFAEIIYTENFEGDASGYTLEDPGCEPLDPINGWSPGIWGLNTMGPKIGLVANAPANRKS